MKTRLLITGLIGIIVVLVIFIIGSNFAESKEMDCLRLYKDIREISRTPGMQLAEKETIQKHRNWIFEYVEKDCPDFADLEFIYNHYKQNLLEPEPETEVIQETDSDSNKYYEEFGGYLSCDKPILEHLLKYSNLLDDEFDGNYGIEDIGLPDGVTQEKFDECVDFILEKRISMELENEN